MQLRKLSFIKQQTSSLDQRSFFTPKIKLLQAFKPLPPKKSFAGSHVGKQIKIFSLSFINIGQDINQIAKGNGNRIRLILMRHGESDSGQTPDHQRSITVDGKQQSQRVGQKMVAMGWVPQMILASDALRTRQTVDIILALTSIIRRVEVKFLGSLYAVAALDGMTRQHLSEQILYEIDQMKQKINCVMCVGHNKGWEEAASLFCGQEIRLNTSSAALLESSAGNWQEALREDSSWTLVSLLDVAEVTEAVTEDDKIATWWRKLLPLSEA